MLPAGLDDVEPGAELATLLAKVDCEELAEFDQVVALRAYQRMTSYFQARTYSRWLRSRTE